MSSFDEIVRKIKAIEIQGAIRVALASIEALNLKSKELKKKNELLPFVEILKKARDTEPAMRNLLNLYMKNLREDLANTDEVYERLKNETLEASERIYEIGSRQIESGMKIFTHCRSSNAIGVLIRAWDDGKRFEVFNTETRPRFDVQGRAAAKTMVERGIPVTHMVDNAAYKYIIDCDIFIFGADSISSSGNIFNKIGTRIFAEIAKRAGVRTICCTNSIKFNPDTLSGAKEKIEMRDPKEVWDFEHPNLKIVNPAFDEVERQFVDSIICEWGLFSPDGFVSRAAGVYLES